MESGTGKRMIPALLLVLLLAGVAVFFICPGRHARTSRPAPVVLKNPAAPPSSSVNPAGDTGTQEAEEEQAEAGHGPAAPAEQGAPSTTVPAETLKAAAPAPLESAGTAAPVPALPETTAAAHGEPTPDCTRDTAAPWVFSDPAGGLYYGPVSLYFHENKLCTIYWRFEPDTNWYQWTADSFYIDAAATLTYRAVDRCGRVMAQRSESYDIKPPAGALACPKGMVPVENGTVRFCIDVYEWPDRKGAKPASYVSVYQAMDSCSNAGKRLCTSDEWSLACAGPQKTAYPYGSEYERRACVTHDTITRPAGLKPECRSYYGAFDMSGNLAEWTSTPSSRDARFYNVMGGFWESGPLSGCFDTRYSYFPQNRHNPVGFRCCGDILPAAGK